MRVCKKPAVGLPSVACLEVATRPISEVRHCEARNCESDTWPLSPDAKSKQLRVKAKEPAGPAEMDFEAFLDTEQLGFSVHVAWNCARGCIGKCP